MSTAYVDTSAIIAVEFNEPGGHGILRRLNDFTTLMSSNLLEAEVRSVYIRDDRSFTEEALSNIEWIIPDSPLSAELEIASQAGYLRGAELWHVATALYIFDEPSEVTFLTLDQRQREVASALGFQV